MDKDFDKFAGFDTENVLKNWGSLVAGNMKNDFDRIESPTFIPMNVVIENYLGVNLTPEQKEYFKDKVLTSIHITDPDGLFTEITDFKATVTVNFTKYNTEE